MKTKNNRYLKTIISLGVGAMLLTGAVFANYESASGYSVCKNALKSLAYSENFSADYSFGFSVDGKSVASDYGIYQLNAGANPSMHTESTGENTDGSISFNSRTVQDDKTVYINKYDAADDENDFDNGYIHNAYNEGQNIVNSMFGAENKNTAEKFINFAETIADTLVGDLKNSFVLTSEENGIKNYSVNLSREQLPSYVTAGVSLFSSVIKNDNTMTVNGVTAADDPSNPYTLIFGSGEPYVKDVNVNMSVDESGNPSNIKASFNFIGFDPSGTEHVFSAELSAELHDFGTTEIERVSDEELAKLDDYTSKEYMEKIRAAASVDEDESTAEIYYEED